MPRRLRVLMTSDAAGGLAAHTRTLAAALTARGHQVWLAVFGPGAQSDWPAGVELFAADYRLEWMDGQDGEDLPGEIAASRRWLQELARTWRPDLLHCNQFGYVGCLAGVPSLLAVHSDVVSWWRNVRGGLPPDSAFHRWYRRLALEALAAARAVAVPSRTAAADLNASFSFAHPVEVIPNGCAAAALPPYPKQLQAVTLARAWDPAKQIALLGACHAARRAGWELAVAGETVHPATGACVPAPEGVRLLGRLPASQAAEMLRRAAVYIATSCYEPFGLAPLEAALSGCALLLNDIPSFREIWGDAAAYFSRNDGAALDAALVQLALAPAEVARLAARAHRRAGKLGADAMAVAYAAAYARCLA